MFKNRERLIIFALAIALIGVLIYHVTEFGGEGKDVKEATREREEAPLPGSFAPPFALTGIEGQEQDLENFLGKPLILTFWNTGVVNENGILKLLEELHLSDEEVAVVTINVGESRKEVESFIQEKEYTLNVLLDKEKEISHKYELETYPTTFALNAGGEIAFEREGKFNEEELQRLVESARIPPSA